LARCFEHGDEPLASLRRWYFFIREYL